MLALRAPVRLTERTKVVGCRVLPEHHIRATVVRAYPAGAVHPFHWSLPACKLMTPHHPRPACFVWLRGVFRSFPMGRFRVWVLAATGDIF